MDTKAFYKHLVRKKRDPRAIGKYIQLVQECEKYIKHEWDISSMDKARCTHLKDFVVNAEKKRKMSDKTYAMSILYYYEVKGDYGQLNCLRKVVAQLRNKN